MNSFIEPLLKKEYEKTVHELNQEIVRLAYALELDLSNPAFLHQFLSSDINPENDRFHKYETLKGLIMLRGQICGEVQEAGIDPLPGPTDESIYQALKVHQPF
jgi:hypothetical protein